MISSVSGMRHLKPNFLSREIFAWASVIHSVAAAVFAHDLHLSKAC